MTCLRTNQRSSFDVLGSGGNQMAAQICTWHGIGPEKGPARKTAEFFISAHADHFLLKGALLFTLCYDMPHRTTRDADLLGFGASDLESTAQTFSDIASVKVDDGIVFDPRQLASRRSARMPATQAHGS